MAMTKMERNTRRYLMNVLRRQGYPTYASILYNCDLNFHNPPNRPFIAEMHTKKGVIYINPTITDPEALSTIIRHEILHNYLQHHNRLMKHLAKKNGLNYDELDDLSIHELEKELYKDKTFNNAADYEISNRGYTEKDKEILRNIGKYGDIFDKFKKQAKAAGVEISVEQIHGLVTEDDHPDWVYYSVEEMYDLLTKQLEKEKQELERKQQEEKERREKEEQERQEQEEREDEEQEQEDEEDNDVIVGYISPDGTQFYSEDLNTFFKDKDDTKFFNPFINKMVDEESWKDFVQDLNDASGGLNLWR